MSITDLSQNLVPLDRLLDKMTNTVSFKESVCLIFHAIEAVSRDTVDPDSTAWASIYQQFTSELTGQRTLQWPQLEITRNDYSRRIDILTITKSFAPSTNICMLLFRLLYIESYKRPYVLKSYNYTRILGHRFKSKAKSPTDAVTVSSLSLLQLFELLAEFIKYYMRIYSDTSTIEYQLGKVILEQIKC